LGRGVIAGAWDPLYEDSQHKSGESSRTFDARPFTFPPDHPSAPWNSFYNTSSKHPSTDTTDSETPKRHSIASSTNREKIERNENGDEIMIIAEDYVDVFKGWADQQDGFARKGKGKVAVEAGSGNVGEDGNREADAQLFAHWVQRQQRQMQMHENECMGKGKGKAPVQNSEAVYLD
jgi:hypothetical protein